MDDGETERLLEVKEMPKKEELPDRNGFTLLFLSSSQAFVVFNFNQCCKTCPIVCILLLTEVWKVHVKTGQYPKSDAKAKGRKASKEQTEADADKSNHGVPAGPPSGQLMMAIYGHRERTDDLQLVPLKPPKFKEDNTDVFEVSLLAGLVVSVCYFKFSFSHDFACQLRLPFLERSSWVIFIRSALDSQRKPRKIRTGPWTV